MATTRHVRYRTRDGRTAYGILEGPTVCELAAAPFAGSVLPERRGRAPSPERTGRELAIDDVSLLAPCEPRKVLAVGRNYRSHLQGRPEPESIGLFSMLPTTIAGPGDEVVMPSDATDVHYEGEMVVVIGQRARNLPTEEAPAAVFGVTAGNDVSERAWQRDDLQWVRAKATDTFAPIGPAIVTGLGYEDLLLQTRVNGETVQSERTRDLIFPVAEVVSFASRYVTLEPGDVIFTGTPGSTSALSEGDVVEVELEGVGVLRNHVVRAGP